MTKKYIAIRNEWSTPCEHEKCNIDSNRIVTGRVAGQGCHSWPDVERYERVVVNAVTMLRNVSGDQTI